MVMRDAPLATIRHVLQYIFKQRAIAVLSATHACVWLLLTGPSFAQTAGEVGQITGVVRDPAQALVPGSRITLTNEHTAVTTTTVTDDQGVYKFSTVPAGTYVVAADTKGFEAATSPQLKVEEGQTVRFDFALALAGTIQSVNVSAGVENAYRVDNVAQGGPSELRPSLTFLIQST